jgi:hypothetical protein
VEAKREKRDDKVDERFDNVHNQLERPIIAKSVLRVP